MARRRTKSGPPLSLFSFQDIITCVTAIMICIALMMALELVTRARTAAPAMTNVQIDRTRAVIEGIETELASLQATARVASSELQGLPTLDESALKRAADQLEAEVQRAEHELSDAQLRARQGQKQFETRTQEDSADEQQVAERLEELKKKLDKLQKVLDNVGRGDRVFFRPGQSKKAIWLLELTKPSIVVARVGVREAPSTFSSVSAPPFLQWLQTLDASANAILIIVKPLGENRYLNLLPMLSEVRRDRERLQVGVQVAGDKQNFIDPITGAGAP